MPNCLTHVQIGSGAALVSAGLHERIWQCESDRNAYRFGASLGGGLGALAPDKIDPPDSPNHRGIGHGIIPATIVTLLLRQGVAQTVDQLLAEAEGLVKPDQWPARMFKFFLAGLIKGFGPGYLSHLAADACTPAGLPLIGE